MDKQQQPYEDSPDAAATESASDNQDNIAAGVHYFTDSGGRQWGIRVFGLDRHARFYSYVGATSGVRSVRVEQDGEKPKMVSTAMPPKELERAWILLLREMLMHPGPEVGWIIRLRRALGLSDYTARYILKNVRFRDAADIREECFVANLGPEKYAEIMAEAKKKQEQLGLK